MGPAMVVIVAPRLDGCARLGQTQEYMLVKAFVAQAAIEGFDEGILRRLARRDVVPVEPPSDQRSTAVLVSSQPLSLTITPGSPRSHTRRSSSPRRARRQSRYRPPWPGIRG